MITIFTYDVSLSSFTISWPSGRHLLCEPNKHGSAAKGPFPRLEFLRALYQIVQFLKGNGSGLTDQETESERRPMGTTGALAGLGTFSRAETDGRMRRRPTDGTLKDGSSALARLPKGLSP